MNPLFEQFFKSADQFINLGKAAPLKQSTYGKQHNEPTKNQITAWNGLILDIEQSKEKLENYTANSIKAHNQDIDTQLGWFRELPRRMDYVDCHWSAYYTKIFNKSLSSA